MSQPDKSNGEGLELADLRPGLLVDHRELSYYKGGRAVDVDACGMVTVRWPHHGQREHGIRFLVASEPQTTGKEAST